MRSLDEPIRKRKLLRAIGFDDAPFVKASSDPVNLSGIVCSGTRFEGMLWGAVEQDGLDATEVIGKMILESKFHEQLNLVLIDGITVAGFNFVDIQTLAETIQIPCVAVMRNLPDMPAFYKAMERVDRQEERKQIIKRAGEIHSIGGFHFQAAACEPDQVAVALNRMTDKGAVPEPLRLAHLIGAAVKFGESTKRA